MQVKKSAVLAVIRDGAWNTAAIASRVGVRVERLYPVLAQLERDGKIVSHYDATARRRRYEMKK